MPAAVGGAQDEEEPGLRHARHRSQRPAKGQRFLGQSDSAGILHQTGGARLVAHGLGGHQDILGLLKKGSRRRRMTPGADVMPEADVS